MAVEIPELGKVHILIIGDVMLDRYWYGNTGRISPEAPVPVVKISQSEERPGGAGNVALNVRALGAQVTLLGYVGDDEAAELLRKQLKGANIHCMFETVKGLPTVTKLRVMSRHQQMIRLDFEEPMHQVDPKNLTEQFKKALSSKVDAVILSDYNKGTLSAVQELIKLANVAKVPVFIDPKVEDFSLYRGATAVTPNFKEFQATAGACHSEQDIVEKGQALLKKCQFESLLITRGEHGMTLIRADQKELHIPTRAKEVFDVTGAGDTVIATLATMYAAGASLPDATLLANIAAGVSVGKIGAATVSLPELRQALANEHSEPGGILTEEQLMLAVKKAKARGQRVVMTNGCFDLLHAGHVHYLNQAKALGNYLIVAVNDDQSVKRLKGEGRPLNTVEKRMTVLASLSSVDWVLPFSEDTPERLITQILPDVLVKGGDYKVEEIAGSTSVLKNGGRVEILDFIEGLSTTSILKRANQQIKDE